VISIRRTDRAGTAPVPADTSALAKRYGAPYQGIQLGSMWYLQLRWRRLSRDLTVADGPRVEVVHAAEIAKRLPYYEHARITEAEHRDRIAARQSAVAQRMLG
jgi:hypothetical protein